MSTIRKSWTIDIAASRAKIWSVLLDDATYRIWTAPFSEGSHAVGDWSVGGKMLFLGPSGEGMVATIDEHRPSEYLSIHHLGMVKDGVEDTTSDAVKEWAGAHENYTLSGSDGAVKLTVDMDVADQYVGYMDKTYPEALAKVKELSEN